VAAEPGLTIEHRGQTVQVLEVGADGAVVGIAGVRWEVPFGTDVRVEGKTLRLLPPGAEPSLAALAAEAALREWRSAVAKEDAVPAYVVLNDKELVGIASELPRTLPDLARCRGIGPLRLEKWGDEILAVLESATTD
jgi:superfamily II DNA helicase RecQ